MQLIHFLSFKSFIKGPKDHKWCGGAYKWEYFCTNYHDIPTIDSNETIRKAKLNTLIHISYVTFQSSMWPVSDIVNSKCHQFSFYLKCDILPSKWLISVKNMIFDSRISNLILKRFEWVLGKRKALIPARKRAVSNMMDDDFSCTVIQCEKLMSLLYLSLSFVIHHLLCPTIWAIKEIIGLESFH